VLRATLCAAVLCGSLGVAGGLPAAAQTATSTAGDVGSAALRNGYPASAGTVALPALPAVAAAATNTAATAATITTTSAGTSRGSGGGGGAVAGAVGAGITGAAGGTNWVLCPPSGGSGLAPLFSGTDLSCAPH
jgi:hypothetical protein